MTVLAPSRWPVWVGHISVGILCGAVGLHCSSEPGSNDGGPSSTGSIAVDATTSGDQPDPDGYEVTVGDTTQALPANGDVTFDSVPAGSQQVSLSGVAENCEVTGDTSVAVTVAADQTAQVSFEVQCEAPILFTGDADGDAEIYTILPNGAALMQLTDNEVGDDDPSWSPDRTEILFSREITESNWEIYRADADGSNAAAVTSNGGTNADPSFSPDGMKIMFLSDFAEIGQWDVYIMDADGQNLMAIAPHSRFDANPDFSPDGTRIAFQSKRDGESEIFLANSDGSGTPTRLTTSGDGQSGDPEWAPDGMTILFASDRTGDFEIWSMDPSGGNLTQLTDEPGTDSEPSYSPDGQRISWSTDRDGEGYQIYIMNADGSDPQRVTTVDAANEEPDWGP